MIQRLTPDACRDALAFMRAHLTGDREGETVILRNSDPVRMIDSVVAYFAGLLITATNPADYLDYLDARPLDSPEFTTQDSAHAVAYMRAQLAGDGPGQVAIVQQCESSGFVAAILTYFTELLCSATDPMVYLDYMTSHVDVLLADET